MRYLLVAMLISAVAGCSTPPQEGAGRDLLPRIVSTPIGLLFAGMDANHDGETTRDEMRAASAAIFRQVDKDHNGGVRAIELQDFAETYLGSRASPIGIEQFDQNADRQADEAELLAYLERRFQEVDTNSDQRLQRTEFINVIEPTNRRGRSNPGQNARPQPRR